MAKLRWRIERDYLEFKREVGLGHYEGRGWRGFHHSATLCVAAYGFPISEKETMPPLQDIPASGEAPRQLSTPRIAAAFATPHAKLNRNAAYSPYADFGTHSNAMSSLWTEVPEAGQAE